MTEPALGNRKFIIEVRDHKVAVSQLPEFLPGPTQAFEYKFTLNERGNNISSEADRIKEEILRNVLQSHRPRSNPAVHTEAAQCW